MVHAGDKLDMSPAEVSRSMQSLYEGGRMSYPRAGTRALSKATANKIAAVLKKAGYNVDGSQIATKSDADAHDAPYPIGAVDLAKSPEKLGQIEGVRTMVARDLVKTGQIHREEVPVLDGIVPFLKSNGFSAEIIRAVAKMPWRREVGPPYPGRDNWPENAIISRRADTVLLEKAVKHNLGRPSTWGRHIEQFMSRDLVDGSLALTAKGQEWIAASPQELLDPRVSAAIEQACDKAPPYVFDNPDREPWELNAERIVQALSPNIRAAVMHLVEHEPAHPKVDPVLAYGAQMDALSAAQEMGGVAPVYAPQDVD